MRQNSLLKDITALCIGMSHKYDTCDNFKNGILKVSLSFAGGFSIMYSLIYMNAGDSSFHLGIQPLLISNNLI